MKNYYLVEISNTNTVDFSVLSQIALQNYGCDGIEEFSLDEPQVDEILGQRSYSGGNLPIDVVSEVEERADSYDDSFKFYFYDENCEKRVKLFCDFLVENEISYRLDENQEKDWNTDWRNSFSPIKINSDLEIIPSWLTDYESSSQTSLYLYPGMGFGTGNHETTYLCLKMFTELRKSTEIKSVLDFGCGSGILGIASLLMDKGHVDFFDIDQEAIENTKQNLLINSINNNYELYLPLKFDSIKKKYDLVFANILADTLLQVSQRILECLNKNGYAILSGILKEQENLIEDHYQECFKIISKQQKGYWLSYLIQKK